MNIGRSIDPSRIIYKGNGMALERWGEAIHVWLYLHRTGECIHDCYWCEGKEGKYYELDRNTRTCTGRTAKTWEDIRNAVIQQRIDQISNYF